MPQFKTDVIMLTSADSGPRDPYRCQVGVFHTTENDDLTPPENVAVWQQNKANGSSYNILVGSNGRSVRSNDDNFIPWAAGTTGNRIGIHASAIGRASRSREDWLKWPAQLDTLARWAADINRRYGIPLKWLTAAQVRAGERGFCGHAEISAAFREVDHTDPGRGFPHDLILARAMEINNPTNTDRQDEIMAQDHRNDLILDQLVGHPWASFPGWEQLGGRSLVDAIGAIGAHLEIEGFKDTRK